MSVAKMKDGRRWYVSVRYRDWTGAVRQHKKEGFPRQCDAKSYERAFLDRQNTGPAMTVETLYQHYRADFRLRLRPSTAETKEFLLERYVLPALGALPVREVTPAVLRTWQGELLRQALSPGYLRSISSQASALFGYAVRYYGLPENPCRLAGSLGRRSRGNMSFWTVEEFHRFLAAVAEDPLSRVLFSLLFWTGMRVGEFLALTPADFDFSAHSISIRRTYQRRHRQDFFSPPKTPNSRRTIYITPALSRQVEDYIAQTGCLPQERLFPFTEHLIRGRMARGCARSGVKRIRIHDLRHSHASFLIEQGFPPILVAQRLGHEKIETTLGTYAHLYPDKQRQLVDALTVWESRYAPASPPD